MDSKITVIDNVQYCVHFTAEEVTAILRKIIEEKYPCINDAEKVSCYGFDSNYATIAMVSNKKRYQDIVFNWTLKN
jgi:hypothetical protein